MFDTRSLRLLAILLICLRSCASDVRPASCKRSIYAACQSNGTIDGCACTTRMVDDLNNLQIYPRLNSLLGKDYFRYFKVNLKRECPFWPDDSQCTIRHCQVETCDEDDVPSGIKSGTSRTDAANDRTHRCEEDGDGDGDDDVLGYLNTSISDKVQYDFVKWQRFDESIDNFCRVDDDADDAEYVDLLLNPERYTGYKGKSANRLWRVIYMENCFDRPSATHFVYAPKNRAACLEKQVFYALISGLHASINVHLCANYLTSRDAIGAIDGGEWGPNVDEFLDRFGHVDGINRLRNLYFLYLVEMRALQKAGKYLRQEEFYTGNAATDADTREAVNDLLDVVDKFTGHFDETYMFVRDVESMRIKDEFKQHFRNITTIMDCVGCEKCKLWGKLQVQGLGTTLNVLFNGVFDDRQRSIASHRKRRSMLRRNDIVALFNSFGRLSKSIHALNEFARVLMT